MKRASAQQHCQRDKSKKTDYSKTIIEKTRLFWNLVWNWCGIDSIPGTRPTQLISKSSKPKVYIHMTFVLITYFLIEHYLTSFISSFLLILMYHFGVSHIFVNGKTQTQNTKIKPKRPRNPIFKRPDYFEIDLWSVSNCQCTSLLNI